MKKISADFVFPVSSAPIKEGVVVLDYNGKILDITSRDEHDPSTIDIHQGVLVPGFINTHCHLELSHMKGMVDTGTGLIPFIHAVVTMRDIPMEKILDAIDQADQDMYDNGIVAVGDISNKLDTVKRKNESPIRYYTFVEMFDFLQNDQAEQHYQNFSEAFKGQSEQGPNDVMLGPPSSGRCCDAFHACGVRMLTFFCSMNSKLLLFKRFSRQHHAAAGRISITASARRRRA
jgi:cytosine/adenosine deaminase-related metal-dependent hydrolase